MLGKLGNNNPAIAAGGGTTSAPSLAGASGPGGLLSNEKDSKAPSTDPQFGSILNQIQSQYGAKAEKPREIKKTLGKDDFLRIMITQMRHQDPTNPFKAEQMATEMAQFTSVEQLQNVNQNLAKMTQANQPLERLAMTNLIGKTVTIDRERFPHTEGANESLSVNLPKDAVEMRMSVLNTETGETVFDKDLGSQKAGPVTFSWDGRKANTLPAKAGTYLLRVEAKDAQGRSLNTNPMGQARIIGVSFEGAEPVFLVGDAHQQAKITMKNIVKIEDSGAMPMAAPLASAGAPTAEGTGPITPAPGSTGPDAKPTNVFTFQKGVGSSSIDATQLQAEARAALSAMANGDGGGGAHAPAASPGRPPAGSASAVANGGPAAPPNERARVAEAAARAAAADDSKGFPNGLHDRDDGPPYASAPGPARAPESAKPARSPGSVQ